jgi:hypothetical protein
MMIIKKRERKEDISKIYININNNNNNNNNNNKSWLNIIVVVVTPNVTRFFYNIKMNEILD